jgi:hypothetical protein
MENTTTLTSTSSQLRSQFNINLQQQLEKVWILQ